MTCGATVVIHLGDRTDAKLTCEAEGIHDRHLVITDYPSHNDKATRVVVQFYWPAKGEG